MCAKEIKIHSSTHDFFYGGELTLFENLIFVRITILSQLVTSLTRDNNLDSLNKSNHSFRETCV